MNTAQHFDFIIVGGGTAGCVLADRLTEDGRYRVLMLEAGGRDRNFWIPIPAGFSKLLTGSRFNWRFETEPEDNTLQRRIVVPRGKGLGGSSLINGMIFVRGQKQDYDGWAQSGATGWSFDDVLPYFKKLERFDGGADEWRGADGPMSVQRVKLRPEIAEAFIAAGEQAGFPRNPDYNGASQEGFGYYQVTQKDGRRWSAADAYLRRAENRPNLSIITGAHVTRLLLDGRNVTGVEYQQDGRTLSVHAGREVIMAAGSVQTPQILELSGIGDPTHLSDVGIETRHALPGVGNNYRDHFCTRMNWRVKKPVTLNEYAQGWRLAGAVAQYFATRTGILTLGTGLVHAFIKTRPELTTPDVQFFFMHASYANAADRKLDKEPGMTIGVTQLRPDSVGSIHVKSPDPYMMPAIKPNFLSARGDAETLIEGMKMARRVIAQPAMDPYRAYEMSPGEEVQTDAQWLDFARSNGQTIYHPVGTCAMGIGPRAVVDPSLRVIGLGGLRIVDASVIPLMVSANTEAAVLMVAEKGSAHILRDTQAQQAA
ncbi:MAG: choline dehydrogenase [Beijerinckiaceae bacterium]|nr:choline dehydrogenase [Beijerinckiaceae bacterium]